MNQSVYQLYGYTPLKINGKYTAVCHVCGKNLQNTTSSRLKLHRKVCKNFEEPSEMDALEDEDESNQETVNPLEISHDEDIKREVNNESESYDINIEDYMNYTSDTPELQKTTRKRRSNIQRATAAKKPNITQRDNSTLSNLRNEKLKSEISFLKSKTKFYANETEKLNFTRTFMILKIKKLRLDIEKLRINHKNDGNVNTAILEILKEVRSLRKQMRRSEYSNKELITTLTEEIISLRAEVMQLKGRNWNEVDTSLLPAFPLYELIDLEEFDEKLSTNNEMRTQLKRVVERVGGRDIPTFIRSAIKLVISDELGINLTWRGTPDKPSIQQFTTFSIIKDVCHSMLPNSTDLIINKIAQRHFLHAKDRVLKRKSSK